MIILKYEYYITDMDLRQILHLMMKDDLLWIAETLGVKGIKSKTKKVMGETYLRDLKTSESVVCIEGCLDWVFYEELPTVETAQDESSYKEIARFRVCPREGIYGIQVPIMTWHSIEVKEPSTIFEAKDGKYVQK